LRRCVADRFERTLPLFLEANGIHTHVQLSADGLEARAVELVAAYPRLAAGQRGFKPACGAFGRRIGLPRCAPLRSTKQ
jgi:hypothetical protein